jgi:hypothetical protein
MIEYMTKDEYYSIIALNKKFEKCLIACGQEICQISKGRDLIGEWTGDIELWDFDKYLVEFEKHSCGESNWDNVYVPIEYLYDVGYREYYKRSLIKQREAAECAVKQRKTEGRGTFRRIVIDERAEYERLKVKFEGERTNTPNITPGRCDMT